MAIFFTLPPAALAQDRSFLGTHRNWDAFTTVEGGDKTCFMVSSPRRSAPEGVNRGKIYITVAHKPARRIRDEVMIDVGYPLRTDSRVTVNIDGKAFRMFTEGDAAWNYDYKADSDMVAAMKRGVNMSVKGTSQRGTNTTDYYSLMGFTAAYNEITKACGR